MMPHFHWVFLLFLIGSCSLRPNGRIIVDGVERTYTVHAPKGAKTTHSPVPLVMVFHGNPSKGWQMQWYTGLSTTADENDFVVAYPDGIDKVWRFDDCDRVEMDVAFVRALLAQLRTTYAIDPERIYFAGISGGSLFLSALSHTMPDEIAAMAKVAAGAAHAKDICGLEEASQAIPTMFIMGTADFLYDGISERGIMSADETIDYWVSRNQTDTIADRRLLPDIDEKDKSKVTVFTYGSPVAPLVYYHIENGGHHWPNARFNAQTFYKKRDLGAMNKDFDTNQVIWDFFALHSAKKNE